MKKRLLLLGLLMFIGIHAHAATCATNPSASPTDVIAVGYPDGSNANGTEVAIPFTIASPCTLATVSLNGYKRGSPAGNLEAAIQGNNAGIPDGIAISSTSTIPFVSGSPTIQTAAITGTLSPGSYWLVILMDGSPATFGGNDYVLDGEHATDIGSEYNSSGSWNTFGTAQADMYYSIDGSSGGGGGGSGTSTPSTGESVSVYDALYWFLMCQLAGFILGIIFSVAFHWVNWGRN